MSPANLVATWNQQCFPPKIKPTTSTCSWLDWLRDIEWKIITFIETQRLLCQDSRQEEGKSSKGDRLPLFQGYWQSRVFFPSRGASYTSQEEWWHQARRWGWGGPRAIGAGGAGSPACTPWCLGGNLPVSAQIPLAAPSPVEYPHVSPKWDPALRPGQTLMYPTGDFFGDGGIKSKQVGPSGWEGQVTGVLPPPPLPPAPFPFLF